MVLTQAYKLKSNLTNAEIIVSLSGFRQADPQRWLSQHRFATSSHERINIKDADKPTGSRAEYFSKKSKL